MTFLRRPAWPKRGKSLSASDRTPKSAEARKEAHPRHRLRQRVVGWPRVCCPQEVEVRPDSLRELQKRGMRLGPGTRVRLVCSENAEVITTLNRAGDLIDPPCAEHREDERATRE